MKEILEQRGSNYGDFNTQANLAQALNIIFTQHYMSTHKKDGKVTPELPPVMAEAIHMILHKIARIGNGNPYHMDSWVDIAGYAQLVVYALEKAAQETTTNNNNEDK